MDIMATTTTEKPIHYPESDGKPMAETDVHIDALIYLRETLKAYFTADPRVYVAGNMLLYYEEGNPAACVAPDVFVVRGVTKRERRTYKIWEEEQPPTVVFEITSRGTRLEDLGTKRALYAELGVQEYFLYDPLGEYLRPPLQGYRLACASFQISGFVQKFPLPDGQWHEVKPPCHCEQRSNRCFVGDCFVVRLLAMTGTPLTSCHCPDGRGLGRGGQR